MRISLIATLLALAPADDGCLDRLDAAEPTNPSRHAAQELWIRECADCHGLTGAADGRLAAKLARPPHSFADACHPISDEWVARVILEGGGSFGGDPAMLDHHTLSAQPDVLAALVDLVQGFRAGKACDAEVQRPIVGPDERD
jgi:hypothetical protein